MASVGEEDVDYESDPEEVKRSLAMRRRAAASDDEEGEAEVIEEPRVDLRAGVHSDESDDQGGAAEYDDDEAELGLEDEEEIEEEEEGEEEVVEEERLQSYQERGRGGEVGGRIDVSAAVKEVDGDERRSVEGSVDEQGEDQEGGEGEEKKENEPFAVPTAGAFYMHDDRFRDSSGGGRQRRMHGGRKLWESKDERKWGHDKFEEMTLHERHYDEGKKSSRGPYAGRGRNRGMDRGYTRGNRSKEFDNNNQRQVPVPKGVRGRGPRRYEPALRNNRQTPPTQNRQSGRPVEKKSQNNSERTFNHTSNAESDPAPARKNIFASSLNSASPPFYPSSSSSSIKDDTLTQKRDVQTGSGKRSVRSSVVQETVHAPQTNSLLRGKNIPDPAGVKKLNVDDSINPASGKTSTNFQMSPSGSSFVNDTRAPQSRAQGRGGAIPGQMSYQPVESQNQMARASPSPHLHAAQRNPIQSLSVQAPARHLGQRPVSGSRSSSPPKTTTSSNSFESGEVESPSDSSKSKGALIAKGKGSVQGSGRGSLTYSGAQVMGTTGSMGVNHGDPNFPAPPAFFPVMQLGGQHPGGMGVPAVGMAFPGYVPGNSEMTWLPVLASAAGALGTTYPYITVDGSYHARPSGQTSSMSSLSKENNANKTNNELKPSQRPEVVGDEYGQRQNKPRRYSQMNVASEVLQNNTELV